MTGPGIENLGWSHFCNGDFSGRRNGKSDGSASLFEVTWRVGGLSKQVVSRLISTLKGTLIGVVVLISP